MRPGRLGRVSKGRRGRFAGQGPGLVVAVVVALLLSGGCGDGGSDAGDEASRPRVGGPVPDRQPPPGAPMDRWERRVAERLARRVSDAGLTLSYLDCPRWDGTMPARVSCKAYVDGLVGRAVVRLVGHGHDVDFEARLVEGVVATGALEARLRREHWQRPDCGPVAAYPATPGERLVCRVVRAGRRRYLVATVLDRSGTVRITGYRDAFGTGGAHG